MSDTGTSGAAAGSDGWPALRVADWTDTRDTLHMWTQIVGKIRLAQAPMVNHWWQVTLYVTPRGLTTSAHPVRATGCSTSSSTSSTTAPDPHERRRRRARSRSSPSPSPTSTPRRWRRCASSGIDVRDPAGPNEVEPAIPFAEDTEHASYDPAAAAAVLAAAGAGRPRAAASSAPRFVGKVSPVHFFWGALRPGRAPGSPAGTAPRHPGGAPNCARLGHGGGLLARAEQLRVLARRRRGRRVLRLRLSRARRLRRPRRSRPTARSTTPTTASSCCRTRRCAPRPTLTRAAGVPADDLRGGRRPRRLGPCGAGA